MEIHSTTIVAVSHKGKIAFAGDGQVTLGNTIMKHGSVKVRRMHEGKIVAGFAGSAADAFTLFERFDGKLNEFAGNINRAAVELAKDWRTDRYLRSLEAMLIVSDKHTLYLLSGSGDVISPDDGIVAIGSGASFALGAARALTRFGREDLGAADIARHALQIAAESCPFTNDRITVEEV